MNASSWETHHCLERAISFSILASLPRFQSSVPFYGYCRVRDQSLTLHRRHQKRRWSVDGFAELATTRKNAKPFHPSRDKGYATLLFASFSKREIANQGFPKKREQIDNTEQYLWTTPRQTDAERVTCFPLLTLHSKTWGVFVARVRAEPPLCATKIQGAAKRCVHHSNKIGCLSLRNNQYQTNQKRKYELPLYIRIRIGRSPRQSL